MTLNRVCAAKQALKATFELQNGLESGLLSLKCIMPVNTVCSDLIIAVEYPKAALMVVLNYAICRGTSSACL